MKKNFFNHNLSSLLGLTDSHILTFTGGGGKTSLMNILGIEFAKQRIPTLLTTTTHIMKPDFLPSKACIEEENLEQITSFFTNLEEDILPLAALGIPEKKIYNKVKWKSPSINFMKKLSLFSRKYSNISLRILCEGDGSKRLPIKLPKDRYRYRRNWTILSWKTNKRDAFSLRTPSKTHFYSKKFFFTK